MPYLQRYLDSQSKEEDSTNGVYETETLDAVVVGAGFAGVYLLVSRVSIY